MSEYMAPSTDFMDCLDILYETAKRCHCEEKIAFHMDCAFSEIYDAKRGTYHYCGREVDLDEIIGILKQATEKYNFLYIEDPVDENDWEGWVKAAKALESYHPSAATTSPLPTSTIFARRWTWGPAGPSSLSPIRWGPLRRLWRPSGMPWITECSPSPPSGRAASATTLWRTWASPAERRAVKLGPPKFGHAIHIVNSLLRAETELPEAKPFDFSPFVKF